MDINKTIDLLYSGTDITKKILSLPNLLSNTEYCSVYIGKGSFGRVNVNKVPSSAEIKLDNVENKITIDSLAAKTININDASISYFIINLVYYNKKERLKKTRTIIDKTNIFDLKKVKKLSTNDAMINMFFHENGLGEGMIAVFISKLFTEGITPHVTLCCGFSDCKDHIIIMYENLSCKTYSDRYVSNFSQYARFFQYKKLLIDEELINYCLISILHTISVIQKKFKMFHSDIHIGNIFIKNTNDKLYFNGMNMNKIDYIEYIYRDGSLFLPYKKYKFILKVGDFGLSTIQHKDIIIINHDSNFCDREKMIKRDYPNYPYDYDNKFPDYFLILRDLLMEFGGISELLYSIHRKIPIMNKGIRWNFMGGMDNLLDKKMLITIDDIFNFTEFDKYRIKPEGVILQVGKYLR